MVLSLLAPLSIALAVGGAECGAVYGAVYVNDLDWPLKGDPRHRGAPRALLPYGLSLRLQADRLQKAMLAAFRMPC